MTHSHFVDERPSEVVEVRPQALTRLMGWIMILVGLALPAAGFAASAAVGDTLGVLAPGLIFVAIGVAMVRARVTANADGVQYRTLLTKSIPRVAISSVDTVERYGMIPFLRFITIVVVEHDGAATKMSMLDRWSTVAGRAGQQRSVRRIRGALGLGI